MDTLFTIQPNLPEGFQYYPDFLSEQEEIELLNEIKKIELHTFLFQGFTAKRKAASFGYDYNFENRRLTKGKDIPGEFNLLVQKVVKLLPERENNIVELLVTEYPAGSVINWHRDAPSFDIIAGVSFLSDCTFRLRPQEKLKQTRQSIISFPVKRRSLYIMKSIARSEWQHSIAPVKNLRYSITLRTLKS